MAKLFNRAKMDTTTTGSGTITLGSAVDGYQTFADAGVADSDVVQYVIEDGTSWEIGTGTYSATGTSLTRTPSESSNAGAAISLTGAAEVFITAVADDLNRLQSAGSDIVTVSASGAAVTGNITVTGTVDGRDIASDGSKLDGIESGADVTDTANVVASLTAGSNVTIAGDGTISSTDTNTTYSNATTSTAGLMSSTDKTKLDGIESGATADQTAAEIRTLVESATDSNVFTDADHTKLDGIESGATADQTAAEILTAIKTVDGSGSGLDADTLDGYHLSTTRNSANTVPVRDANGYLQLGWINTTSGATTSTINKIYASYDDYIRYVTPATLISQLGLWTSGNDGSGSGLDADLLDGQHASAFQPAANELTWVDQATGNYGTIKVDDDRAVTWAGYAIRDDWVLMSDGASNLGIYNDTDNEWMQRWYRNGNTELYNNGAVKVTIGSTYMEMSQHLDMNNYDIYGCDQLFHHGDTNTYMQFHASDQWRVVAGGTERLEVTNGTITVNGTLNNTSDERLKENIQPIKNALSDVAQLEGVSFDWKDTGIRGHGFIAQQIETVIPEVVDTDEETGIKSVNYVGVIGHLVEAIKELKAEIEELKS